MKNVQRNENYNQVCVWPGTLLPEDQIEQFVALGWVRRPADIFRLAERRAEMATLDGYGDISIGNLLAAIETRREIGLERVIFALGIRQVGQATARLLALH